MKFCWIVTLLLSSLAMIVLLNASLTKSVSAPQLAAAAGVACALCVIPYVFTRAIEGIVNPRRKQPATTQENHTPESWRHSD